MPEEGDVVQLIDETGAFTDGFRSQLPTMVGEEHKDTKAFDDVPNLGTLAKNYAHLKSAYGKKMDNVIQKPGQDAKPEEVQAYRQGLLKELGVPDKPEDYEFPELQEGETYDENSRKAWAAKFKEIGVPKDMAKGLISAFHEQQRLQYAAIQKAFDDDCTALTKDWPGETGTKNLRIAALALREFAADDLKKAMTEAKLFDKPDDLKAWAKVGVTPSQLRVWKNIGERALGARALAGEGGGGALAGGIVAAGGYTAEELASLKLQYPRTPQHWDPNHPKFQGKPKQ